ncbi:hypothetical protein BV20DRAFT_967620 [Pilatotrama ljubarskyi]|nr:hypothetical protein BV20DRAFT_967620 [Pilatotrama ljubarskyi]
MCSPNYRLDVQARIDVPGRVFVGFKDWDSAEQAFNAAYERGETRIVRTGPPSGQKPQGSRRKGVERDHGQLSPRKIQEKIKREQRQRNGTSSTSTQNGSQETTTMPERAAAATTTTAQAMEPPRPRQPDARHTTGRPAVRAPTQVGHTTGESPSEVSTSSSPPTEVTQVEHGTDSAPSPRYAQSLSYTSDASPPARFPLASPASGSSALASSDRRSDVSLPSSGMTKYFPADFAVRPRDKYSRAREKAMQASVRSPTVTISDYGTPPSSVQSPPADLNLLSPIAAASAASGQRIVASSPAGFTGTATPTRRQKIAKTTSDAGVQVDRQTRIRTYTAALVQATEDKRYATVQTQTLPAPAPQVRGAPLRATASAGDVLDNSGAKCACEHPVTLCRHCGLRARVMRWAEGHRPAARAPTTAPATSPVPQAPIFVASPVRRAPLASPVLSPTRVASPAPSSCPGSPESFHSAISTISAHTPIFGSSEIQPTSAASMGSVQEGLDVMVRATPGSDASGRAPVLHDTTFDPRSPLHRGTLIPARSPGANALTRPSPMMVPLNSLLFS